MYILEMNQVDSRSKLLKLYWIEYVYIVHLAIITNNNNNISTTRGRPLYYMYPNRSEQTSKYPNRNVHT